MRLFTAINFTDEIKDGLCEVIDKLKENSIKGNFTLRDNLHLTLVFIGETTRINDVKHVMEDIRGEEFSLNIAGLGRFRRPGGDIVWAGVEKNSALFALQRQLSESLAQCGFKVERREYAPHLTLGREVVLKEGFDIKILEKSLSVPDLQVNKVSLMESAHKNGKLTYTEIFNKKFEKRNLSGIIKLS